MKLISSKGKGRRVANNSTSADARNSSNTKRTVKRTTDSVADTSTEQPKTKRRLKRLTKKSILVIVSSVVGLIIILAATAFAVVRWEVQPFYDFFFKPGISVLAAQPAPRSGVVFDVNNPDRPSLTGQQTGTSSGNEENSSEDTTAAFGRDMNMFTFLILGIDLDGNTDVIMVARFDAIESSLNVVSIPRDTVVNVPWNLKKVNSIHAHARNMFRGQNVASDDVVRETVDHFRNFLGFNIDFMVTISMNAFPRIVDAVGPIEFNVPRAVNVDGVRVARGVQKLNGQQAMAVMRDRSTHPNGDIGRATTHQQFVGTIMKQFLERRNSIKIDDMADIFLRHTNTNIQLNNLVWLGKEFLKIDAENINFFMMPGEFETLRGNFYITVQLDPWLELVNEKISPLLWEITAEDVSILTRGADRLLYVTDGNWQGDSSWGGTSRGSSNPQTTLDP